MADYYLQYPPLPNQSTQDFIDGSGITATGNLMDDFRSALVEVLSSVVTDHNKYTLDDLWQLYVIHVVAGDSNTESGNPASNGRGKGGFVGNPPGLYYAESKRNDAAVGFPLGAGGADITPWNTTIVTREVNPWANNSGMYGFHLSENGLYMYMHDSILNQYQRYDLSAAYSLASFPNSSPSQTLAEQSSGQCHSLQICNGGTQMLVHHIASSTAVYQATLGTPYDLTSAGAFSNVMNTGNNTRQWMATDGSAFFVTITGIGTRELRQYNLSTPFDLSTAAAYGSPDKTLDWSAVITNGQPANITMSQDGTYLYAVGTSNNVHVWQLSSAHDLASPTYKGEYVPTTYKPAAGMIFDDVNQRFWVASTNSVGYYTEDGT